MSLQKPDTVAALRARFERITPDAKRVWGKMSVDQMLWHVATNFEMGLGLVATQPIRLPAPLPVVRAIALYLPWPKGSPTAPELLADSQYDFELQRARCIARMEELAQKPMESEWPTHPAFGKMTGAQWKRLEARHANHHLKQFSF